MKLPSGREIPNSRIADVIDAWVLRALESEENLKDWENVSADDLSEEGPDGSEGYYNDDIEFILNEIRPTAQSFLSELQVEHGKLFEKHVSSKYPY